ncbi:MAG: putative endonuclease [Frankiales bacterium]|nr:putative endonuclease [Frankiales bacterium]
MDEVRRGGSRQLLDLPAVDTVETQLVELERDRQVLHGRQLQAALRLARLHRQAGMQVATVPQLALLWGCSKLRAGLVLSEAEVLADLPDGLASFDAGLLTVETSRAVADLLGPLEPAVRRRVWDLLVARLDADAQAQAVRPPSRLRELLRRLVERVDAEGAAARRREARRGASVELRSRDDGLVDLFALGLPASAARACKARLDDLARTPVGTDDDRTVGQRSVDALVDLLLGRDWTGGATTCGHGSAVCGAQVQVLVPLATARAALEHASARPEHSDPAVPAEVLEHSVPAVPAEVLGHGPIGPDELRGLLRAAPSLRPVWVDERGVPVAVRDRPVRLRARDDVDDALDRLGRQQPPERLHPRHPDDHPALSAGDRPERRVSARDDLPCRCAPPPARGPHGPHGLDGPHLIPSVLAHPHAVGTPGPYRVPADLARLLDVRSPRCEWPGCGARASRCDHDHDVAHPAGPTCGCNLGPLCRRHHRVKQTGFLKQRTADAGMRWTSPTGRTWTSPPQHGGTSTPGARNVGVCRQDRDSTCRHDDPSPLERELTRLLEAAGSCLR